MITDAQAIAIQHARQLTVRVTIVNGLPKYRAYTVDNQRAAPGNLFYATVNDALEAAEAYLASLDNNREATIALQVVAALKRGRYFLRPRAVNVGGETKTVFDAFRPDNSRITEVSAQEGYIKMVRDVELFLGP